MTLMNNYTAKTLISGHQVHPDLAGKILVGVPEKSFYTTPQGETMGKVLVSHDDEKQLVDYQDNVGRQLFDDKFRPGEKYALVYFVWKPTTETQERLI
jgi:hypothetical protein